MSLRILISGVGRSGTTALYELLQRLMRANDLDPRCRYEPYLWRPEVFEHLAVDDEAFRHAFRSTSALSIEGMYAHARTPLFATRSPPEHAMFIDRLFGAGQPTLAKVIRGCGRLETFLGAVPDLKIVHIVRNPLDVANSALGLFSFFGDEYHPSDKPRFVRELRQRLGVDLPPEAALLEAEWSALWWRYMNLAALDTATRFPARVLAVSHEALTTARQATVRQIAAFCELDLRRLGLEPTGKTLWSSGARAKLDAGMLSTLRSVDQFYWSDVLPRLDPGIDLDRLAAQRAVAAKYANLPASSAQPDRLASDLVAPALRAQLGRALHRLETLDAAACRDRPSRSPGPKASKEGRWRRKLRKLPSKAKAWLSAGSAHRSAWAGDAAAPRARGIEVAHRHPPIACIITSYNNGGALKNAVLSVCTQTLPVAEVLVSDDASSDGSRELIRHLAREFPNLKPILQEHNLGTGLNRHLAILASTAPFITQLDGDDVIHPRKIEREAAALRGQTDAVAFSDWLTVEADGRTRQFAVQRFAALGEPADRLKALLSRSVPLPHNMLYSRDLYVRSGGYETSATMYEDLSLKLRLAREATAWCHADGCGLYYSKHGAGASAAPKAIHAFWLLYCLAQNIDWLRRFVSADDLREVVRDWSIRLIEDATLVALILQALDNDAPDQLESLERALFHLARARRRALTLADAAVILEGFAIHLGADRAVAPLEGFERTRRETLSA